MNARTMNRTLVNRNQNDRYYKLVELMKNCFIKALEKEKNTKVDTKRIKAINDKNWQEKQRAEKQIKDNERNKKKRQENKRK